MSTIRRSSTLSSGKSTSGGSESGGSDSGDTNDEARSTARMMEKTTPDQKKTSTNTPEKNELNQESGNHVINYYKENT